MNHYLFNIASKETKNFSVVINAFSEDFGLDKSGFSMEEFPTLEAQIADGTFELFEARVSVRYKGVLIGEVALGQCIYEDGAAFLKDGYARQMVAEAIHQAREFLSDARSLRVRK